MEGGFIFLLINTHIGLTIYQALSYKLHICESKIAKKGFYHFLGFFFFPYTWVWACLVLQEFADFLYNEEAGT